MASEKSARAQPNSCAMGIWNTPKLALTAKDSIRMMQPAIKTGVTSGAFAVLGMGNSFDDGPF